MLIYLMDLAKAEAVEKDKPKQSSGSSANPKALDTLFGPCSVSALEESADWERLTIGNPFKQRNIVWAFGKTFRARLLQYMRLLRWPTKCGNGGRSITFLELLLDYEITFNTRGLAGKAKIGESKTSRDGRRGVYEQARE